MIIIISVIIFGIIIIIIYFIIIARMIHIIIESITKLSIMIGFHRAYFFYILDKLYL